MTHPKIETYDATLRDGMQGEGMSLSVEEKVRVARILDDLGVPMIEAGFPTSNPKELELFERLREAGLPVKALAAHPGFEPRMILARVWLVDRVDSPREPAASIRRIRSGPLRKIPRKRAWRLTHRTCHAVLVDPRARARW